MRCVLLVAIDDAVARLERRGIAVLVSGIRPGHRAILQRSGALAGLMSAGRVFPHTPEAIEEARLLVAAGAR